MIEQMNLIQETVKRIEEAKAKYKEAIAVAIEPGLKYIAKTHGEQIKSIHIIAYTPGFNDGEPCEHTVDWGIGFSWLENYGLEYLLDDWFEDASEEELGQMLERNVESSKELCEFTDLVLVPHFEDTLGTDFRVHIFFKDGSYTIKEDEYDCGY